MHKKFTDSSHHLFFKYFFFYLWLHFVSTNIREIWNKYEKMFESGTCVFGSSGEWVFSILFVQKHNTEAKFFLGSIKCLSLGNRHEAYERHKSGLKNPKHLGTWYKHNISNVETETLFASLFELNFILATYF